jgi:hypothetical protein
MPAKVLGLLLLLISSKVCADFSIEGKLALQFSDGRQQQQVFPIQLIREQGNYLFSAGSQQTRLNAPLQKYSLALILQNDQNVWVTDFANQPLTGFLLEIAGYEIALRRDPQARTARGNYQVQFNDEIFYFSSSPGQINFLFNEQGIAEIQVKGMFKPRR